jgi:hypothetical protein
MPLDDVIRKLDGANMDIDLATPTDQIVWDQDTCPRNEVDGTSDHR